MSNPISNISCGVIIYRGVILCHCISHRTHKKSQTSDFVLVQWIWQGTMFVVINAFFFSLRQSHISHFTDFLSCIYVNFQWNTHIFWWTVTFWELPKGRMKLSAWNSLKNNYILNFQRKNAFITTNMVPLKYGDNPLD